MAGASTISVAARPGTKAKVRYVRMSASKVRVVLDLIRGKRVTEAIEILEFSERLAAKEILKCLRSAVANAEHNEEIPVEELFVSVCFADQGPTLRRFRPRARGRAGRIQKQTCHITVEVSRLTAEELDELRERGERKSAGKASSKKSSGGDRAARVAKSKAAAAAESADAVEDANVEAAEVVKSVEDAADESKAEAEVAASEDDVEADTTDSEDADTEVSVDAGEEE